MPSIKENLNKLMGYTEVIIESKDLSDDELVQLSILNYGTILPNNVEPSIRKKLVSSGFLDNKGIVTEAGKKFLKDSKTIKRLQKIAD